MHGTVFKLRCAVYIPIIIRISSVFRDGSACMAAFRGLLRHKNFLRLFAPGINEITYISIRFVRSSPSKSQTKVVRDLLTVWTDCDRI